MQAIRKLHQDDPDVVHHGEEHFSKVLSLSLLTRRKGNRAKLCHSLDDVGDVGPEQLRDTLYGRLGVLDNVVQQTGGNGDDVELHVSQLVGHLERVNQIRLTRVAHLSLVLEGGEDIGPPEQLYVGLGIASPDLFDDVLEPDHVFGV
jgi:hypothetical protein